ncbi:bleomycin resistance protein [Maribacter litoralis]|uniref:bleomycin resistance protein n=1 Tax=Maribacter litoralis TaxID=2059726 RepID=UPI000E316FFA|nr:VOC family protein [Maribacter litoralis]
MLQAIHPKLPMRDKEVTKSYYIDSLGFKEWGVTDYPDYLMLEKNELQLHFFLFKDLNPRENYGQVYIRVNQIEKLYQSLLKNKVAIHPNGKLETKPWGQKEFSLLDPDSNLLTFGASII